MRAKGISVFLLILIKGKKREIQKEGLGILEGQVSCFCLWLEHFSNLCLRAPFILCASLPTFVLAFFHHLHLSVSFIISFKLVVFILLLDAISLTGIQCHGG